MLFFAATALEKLHDVPASFWIKVALGITGFVAALFVLRKIAQMNKIILLIIIFMIVSIVGFQWIYERNEPAFLTPAVDVIAQFLPSKNSYGSKQQQDVDKAGQKKLPPGAPKH